MNEVIGLFLEGYEEKEIATQLRLYPKDVRSYISEFKQTAIHAQAVNDRAYELLAGVDTHYSKLIRRAYEVIDEVDAEINAGGMKASLIQQKTSAIKLVAELERQRLEAFNKAGMLEGIDLGNQIADSDEKIHKTLELLTKVVRAFPETREMISEGIADISGKSVPVEYDGVVDVG